MSSAKLPVSLSTLRIGHCDKSQAGFLKPAQVLNYKPWYTVPGCHLGVTAAAGAPRPHKFGEWEGSVPFGRDSVTLELKQSQGHRSQGKDSRWFSDFQWTTYLITTETVKIMLSLCINFRCGTPRTKAMGDVQNFRGMLFNIAKNVVNYPVLLFPMEGRTIFITSPRHRNICFHNLIQ